MVPFVSEINEVLIKSSREKSLFVADDQLVVCLRVCSQVFKDEKYLKDAAECGEVIWQRGLLRKGYGICHGTAGNGYAFLSLYKLTQEQKYLYRACKVYSKTQLERLFAWVSCSVNTVHFDLCLHRQIKVVIISSDFFFLFFSFFTPEV